MATGDKKTVVMQADRAIPNGVATLDESGVLDSLQWPDIGDFGAADRILSNLTDPAQALSNLGAKSNDNLLINSRWDNIDNIIDQRGGYVVPPDTPYYSDTALTTQVGTVTAYTKATNVDGVYGTVTVSSTTYYVDWTAAVRGYVGAGYTINGWKHVGNSITAVVGDGCISLAWIASSIFVQPIENPSVFNGKTITISGIFKNVDGSQSSIVLRCRINNTWTDRPYAVVDADGLSTVTVQCPAEVTSIVFEIGCENGSCDVVALKLEFGSTQTLARQDANGNWVLNDPPPDKHLELLKCCMSTADPTDTYANNKLTPAAINAVNNAGDTMAGPLKITLSSSPGEMNMQPYNNVAYIESYVSGDYATRRKLALASAAAESNLTNALRFENVKDGTTTRYNIFHTGNKPSGSYTGNGDATARTIETGGIGRAIAIISVRGSVLVIQDNAFTSVSGKVSSLSNGSVVVDSDGSFRVTSSDIFVNESGTTYNYYYL